MSGCLDERAANPLYRRRINAKLRSSFAHAQAALASLPDSLLSLFLGPPKPGADSFLDHRPLELGKDAHHLWNRALPAGVVVSMPC
jgi:hypothetical protein